MYSGSRRIGWTEVERLAKILSEKISAMPQSFSSISTVSRGGLIPARLLADRLGIDTIRVDMDTIPPDSVFVDDIYDSGSTFKRVMPKAEDASKLVCATLFARRGKRYPKQLVFAEKTEGNEYIVYPWEKLESKRLQKSAVY